MNNTYVPLVKISSGVAGPLGVLHLPRFWLKTSLESRGKLAPGYPGGGKGYDQMVLGTASGSISKKLSITSKIIAPLILSSKAGLNSSPAPSWIKPTSRN